MRGGEGWRVMLVVVGVRGSDACRGSEEADLILQGEREGGKGLAVIAWTGRRADRLDQGCVCILMDTRACVCVRAYARGCVVVVAAYTLHTRTSIQMCAIVKEIVAIAISE